MASQGVMKMETTNLREVIDLGSQREDLDLCFAPDGRESLMNTVDALLRNGRLAAFGSWNETTGKQAKVFEPVNGAYIHIIQKGECRLDLFKEHREYRLEQGDVILLPQGSKHMLVIGKSAENSRKEGPSFAENSGAEVYTATYTLSHPSPLLRLLPLFIRLQPNLDGHDARVFELADLLLDGLLKDGNRFIAVWSRLVEAILLAGIAREMKGDRPLAAMGGHCLDVRIARSIASMTSDYQHPWTIESLADECSMSRSAFAACFKKAVGKTPKAYLTCLRMDDARQLLSSTNLTLAEIAEKVGYASEFSFSHAFKKDAKMAPGAYRQKNRMRRNTWDA